MTTITIDQDATIIKVVIDALRAPEGTLFYREAKQDDGTFHTQLAARNSEGVHLDTVYEGEAQVVDLTVLDVLQALEEEAMMAMLFGDDVGSVLDRHGLTDDDKEWVRQEILKAEAEES
jgi:hypothetical protein